MNISNPRLCWQLAFEGAWPAAVTFLGSSRRLAAANQSGQIFIWDLPEAPPDAAATEGEAKPGDRRQAPTVNPSRRLDGHANGVTRLVASSDGETLISASLDRTLRLWRPSDASTGTAEVVLDLVERQAESRRKGNDDALQAPGAMVETLAASHVFSGHEDWILSLGVSADGQRMISGDMASRVIVWDLAERRELARWSGYPWNWIVAVALSPDGQTAAVSEHRYKRDDFDVPAAAVRLFDANRGTEKLDILKTILPNYKPDDHTYGGAQVWRKFVAAGLVAAEFSPDGQWLALGQGGETEMGKVHLLQASTAAEPRELSGHQWGVTDVRFSADGQYLLTTGRDTMLRICQVSDGKEVVALGSPRGGQFTDWFSALAISPDQSALAATDIAGTVHVWSL